MIHHDNNNQSVNKRSQCSNSISHVVAYYAMIHYANNQDNFGKRPQWSKTNNQWPTRYAMVHHANSHGENHMLQHQRVLKIDVLLTRRKPGEEL